MFFQSADHLVADQQCQCGGSCPSRYCRAMAPKNSVPTNACTSRPFQIRNSDGGAWSARFRTLAKVFWVISLPVPVRNTCAAAPRQLRPRPAIAVARVGAMIDARDVDVVHVQQQAAACTMDYLADEFGLVQRRSCVLDIDCRVFQQHVPAEVCLHLVDVHTRALQTLRRVDDRQQVVEIMPRVGRPGQAFGKAVSKKNRPEAGFFRLRPGLFQAGVEGGKVVDIGIAQHLGHRRHYRVGAGSIPERLHL